MTEAQKVEQWLKKKLAELQMTATTSIDPDGKRITIHIHSQHVSFEVSRFVESQIDCFLRLRKENPWVMGAAMDSKKKTKPTEEITEEEVGAQYKDIFHHIQNEYDDCKEFESTIKSLVADLRKSKLDFPVDFLFGREQTFYVSAPRE